MNLQYEVRNRHGDVIHTGVAPLTDLPTAMFEVDLSQAPLLRDGDTIHIFGEVLPLDVEPLSVRVLDE